MKFRGLLIAVALLAALGGLIFWSERSRKANEAQPETAEAPRILTVAGEQLRKIEIRKTSQPAVVLEKLENGGWEITAPEKLEADADAVSSLVSTLTTLNADRVVEEKVEDVKPFGLEAPALTVVVTLKDGKSYEVRLGSDTPTGGATYAQLAGDARLFTVASWNRSSLDKSVADLREKRLLRFNTDQVSRVELEAKGDKLEFGKIGEGAWQILKPKPLRADGGAVGELVRVLADARMDSSAAGEEPKATAAIFAAAARVGVARVTDAAGTQEIEVRKTKDNNYYARSSRMPGYYRVYSTLGEGLNKGLSDFRNKKLFDFGWTDPVKVEVRDGDKQVSYRKQEEKWWEGDKRLAPETVQQVIDKLRDLAASGFPEAGFTKPVIEARVTLEEGKKTEKVLIAQSGTKWIAQREGEPSLYELEATVVEELRKAIAGVKEYEPPKEEKKK